MNDSPLRSAVARPVRTEGGARTELRLLDSSAGRARYEVRWFLGTGTADQTADAPDAHGVAEVGGDADVLVTPKSGQVPDWLLTFTEKLLRTTARSVQDGRFPRRLTRWRDG